MEVTEVGGVDKCCLAEDLVSDLTIFWINGRYIFCLNWLSTP
jgi:hypothetical protein